MTRPRYPVARGPLPPPLPPAARTVGQLVAESLRLYGSRFLLCLALGLPVAIVDQLLVDRPTTERVIVLLAAGPLFSVAFAGACAIRQGASPPLRQWARAVVVGSLTFVPAALLLPWFALAGVAYLALVGQAVPAVMAEGIGFGAALRRGVALGRADIVHAIGGLATLSLLFGLTRLVLGLLLRSQAGNTLRVSIFLADVVIAPILFLGAAMLYVDLAARVGLTRADRARLRGEAVRGSSVE
jgi:hypothetical protein